jgi:hypothetical protein
MTMHRFLFGTFALVPLAALAWHTRQAVVPERDPVADLESRILSGKTQLRADSKLGYLASVLKELNVPIESQIMVFSKTSLQTDFISRKTPRAFYFNDHVYIGYIPDAPLIEIMSIDPVRGARFYTIPNRPLKSVRFDPDDSDCNRCHLGGGNAPGLLLVRSVHTAPSGYARVLAPIELVLSGTPLEKRWGGWYVTGTHGPQRHMGNVESIGDDENNFLDVNRGANQTKLPSEVEQKRYLSASSDIVALMVFERQMDVQNMLSRASGTARRSGQRPNPRMIENLVDLMLGVGETTLSAPLKGTTTFTETYSRSGRADRKGRSFHQLELKGRLYKYQLHPLIDSPSFDAMPAAARQEFYRQLNAILTGENASPQYRFLSTQLRQDIREMLIELKPEFALVAQQE